MALQKMPPLGWPHTEAEKYRHGLATAPPMTGAGEPSRTDAPPARRGCCGVVFMLLLLAAAGIAAALVVGVASLDDVVGSSDFDAAETAFLEQHPEWEVEVSDYPDTGSSTVRIVAWDAGRGIGRLAFMDPDTSAASGWSERPIAPDVAPESSEALLDAFATAYSTVRLSYLRDAEPIDTAAAPEQWAIRYRIWAEDTGEWSALLVATAYRDATTDTWAVQADD